MSSDHAALTELPEGIFSLLDTDLYKLTMQCAILKYLPDVRECLMYRPQKLLLSLSRCDLCIHQPDSKYATESARLSMDRRTSQQ